jgi:anti-anti-sigma factor
MNTVDIRHSQAEGGIPVLEVEGVLDAHNFEQLEQAFDSYFDRGVYTLIVEIPKLEYISSAGAGVFIGAAGRAQANEGAFVVVAPRENVQEIFDLLGICHVFPVVDSRQKALAQLAPVR